MGKLEHRKFGCCSSTRLSEAAYVLDGLLHHASSLTIREHYTDTGGATEHVFGLCHLLALRFAPRLRDPSERRLYISSIAALTTGPSIA